MPDPHDPVLPPPVLPSPVLPQKGGPEHDTDDLVALVAQGDLVVHGRMTNASNATLLAEVSSGDTSVPVIYKPRRGERPLWDFPRGTLCHREVATYVVSNLLGLHLVPPTVLRDGPYGVGSVQVFVTEDHDVDVIDMVDRGDEALVPFAFLDVIVNNADRKIGHCLADTDGHIWGIDHGLTFNDEPKLRTVLWHWAGEPLPPELTERASRLRARLGADTDEAVSVLCRLLRPGELEALRARLDDLVDNPVFPLPDPYGPAIPWPPY